MQKRKTKQKSATSIDGEASSSKANSRDRIASFVGPAAKAEEECAFCEGTSSQNKVTNLPEVLISCVECGSSGEYKELMRAFSLAPLWLRRGHRTLSSVAGHPTCMKWGKNQRKIAVTKEYNWRCMECKTCEICSDKGDDVSAKGEAERIILAST
jgi:ribosomal protein L44E